MTRCHCSILKDGLGNLSLYHSLLLILYCSTHTDSPLLTRSTYLSDHGPCAAMPVYKRPVFRQPSPKLDLILNINILESFPSASPFLISYISLSESSLATLETSTSLKYLPPVHLLVQVVLSRPVEALTPTTDQQANNDQQGDNDR